MNHYKENYKNKYENFKKIGRGVYTDVYKAENKNTKRLRAIKIFKLDDLKLELNKENSDDEVSQILKKIINDLNNEINIMKICSENNINSVKYYESFETENEFAIVLELCNESLTNFKKNKQFNSNEIYEILNQLNNTFKVMKEKKIVHRDLKPDNILIKKEKNKNIIKLCDYGISKIGQYSKLTSHKGTSQYMAPEIMKGETFNYKCDLWSLGIIIYELFFKVRPYIGENEYTILKEIEFFGKKKIKKTKNDKLDDLIDKLLEKDPKNRITWDDYFNHPFFIINIKEISIIYKKYENENDIKIFGNKFVENNKNKCKFIYKEKEYELQEYFEIKENELEIKLNGIDKITDMSYMFHNCYSLESLPDISNLNTNNVTDMSHLFYFCESLKSLPYISKWITNNVTNMSYMFSRCYSLESLPDISNWNTSNVTDMNNMFSDCKSLKALPDISKWNINKVTNINHMFYDCQSLKSLPDISKWKTINVTDMNNMFGDCILLESLPDISQWEIFNVSDISYLYYYFKALTSLPDIAKWKTNNVTNMRNLFYYCSSLKSFPDLSNWVTDNVTNINGMFSYCKSLKSLPDISKWDTTKVTDKHNMFEGCPINLDKSI